MLNTADDSSFGNMQMHLYLWQVMDTAQVEGLEDEEEAVDDIGSASILLNPYLWQVWDRAQVEGLEDATEALDSLGFANTLLKPYLWQVWDRAQAEGLEEVTEALASSGFGNTLLKPYLWQVWDRAQVEGLENVEEAPDDLGVVAGHGRVPQVAHQCVDRDCGVVILAARHQSCCWQQIPSILSVPPYSSCKHQNIRFKVMAEYSLPSVSKRQVVCCHLGG